MDVFTSLLVHVNDFCHIVSAVILVRTGWLAAMASWSLCSTCFCLQVISNCCVVKHLPLRRVLII